MQYIGLQDFQKRGVPALINGPLALILIEDGAAAVETIEHHVNAGFPNVAVFANDALPIPGDLEDRVHRVTWDMAEDAPTTTIVNTMIDACPGRWMYYCYNAEFLFYPFCEQRSIAEMIAFNVEERRDTILTYVIDLYAGDLRKFPNAVDIDGALLDKSGYYALSRTDRWNNPLDRQMDFYGGLRWRFEEHIPEKKRRIDRSDLTNKDCVCLRITPSATPNTTPSRARGITTSQRRSVHSELPRRSNAIPDRRMRSTHSAGTTRHPLIGGRSS